MREESKEVCEMYVRSKVGQRKSDKMNFISFELRRMMILCAEIILIKFDEPEFDSNFGSVVLLYGYKSRWSMSGLYFFFFNKFIIVSCYWELLCLVCYDCFSNSPLLCDRIVCVSFTWNLHMVSYSTILDVDNFYW